MHSLSFLLKEPQKGTIRIAPLEWGIILSFVLGGGLWGYRFAPGPVYWDDLLYLYTAWSKQANPGILNRYTTIYLLRVFNSLAGGDPILGGRIFGAFTFSIIIALVYLNARVLAKSHAAYVGLFAVLFLFSFIGFVLDFGIVLADYTVTMMILFGIFIFLIYSRSDFPSPFLLVLFGLILFLAFKSKETGAFLCLLIPGFFARAGKKFTQGKIVSQFGLILSGVVLGIVLVVALNAVFLKEAFFGLRSSDLGKNISFIMPAIPTAERTNSDNYFHYIVPTGMFLLSLVWILTSEDDFTPRNRWLWGSVLGMIAFLALFFLRYGLLTPRYLTPAAAILSILAPQALRFENGSSISRAHVHTCLLVPGSLILAGTITLASFIVLGRPLGWEFDQFSVGFVTPIALCVLLFGLTFRNQYSRLSLILMIICIGAMTLPTGMHHVYLVLTRQAHQYSQLPPYTRYDEARFLPFSEFSNMIDCNTDNKVLISGSIYQEHTLLSRDSGSSYWMYNLFFRCQLDRDRFVYGETREDIYRSLLVDDYQYAFLDDSDYVFLSNQTNQGRGVFERYSVVADDNKWFYLLKIKP